MPIPSARASAGPASTSGRPIHLSSPSLGWMSPYMILTSVDLPAPFSPSSAWISAGNRSRSIESLARKVPYRLTMPIACSSGSCASEFAGDGSSMMRSRETPVDSIGDHRPDRNARLEPARLAPAIFTPLAWPRWPSPPSWSASKGSPERGSAQTGTPRQWCRRWRRSE
jgi:hypothetical protein